MHQQPSPYLSHTSSPTSPHTTSKLTEYTGGVYHPKLQLLAQHLLKRQGTSISIWPRMPITEGKVLYHMQPHQFQPPAAFRSPRLPRPLTRAPILHPQGEYGCTITQDLLRKRDRPRIQNTRSTYPCCRQKATPHFPGPLYL